jgi:hypothetical protein
MFSFFKKQIEEMILLLEISESFSRAVLLKISDDKKPLISGIGLKYFDKYSRFENINDFDEEVLKRSILESISEAADYSNIAWDKKIPVYFMLSPDIIKARVVNISFKRPEPKIKISEKEEKAIIALILKEAEKEIGLAFSLEKGILSQELEYVKIKTCNQKIDGYPILHLKGYDGEKLDFDIFAEFGLRQDLKKIKSVAAELELNFCGFSHIAEKIACSFDFNAKDGIFFDIEENSTQIFFVKSGFLHKVFDFNLGTVIFQEKITDSLGLTEDSARNFINEYYQDKLSPEAKERVRELLTAGKNYWRDKLKENLNKTGINVFPVISFVFGPGANAPEIREIFEENSSKIIPVLPKNMKNIIFPEEFSEDSKCVPIFLLANNF